MPTVVAIRAQAKTTNAMDMKRSSIFLYRLIEYYDKALFKLAIPLLAPLFFPHSNPETALLWGYLLIPLTTVSRPIGSLIFGYMSEIAGTKRTYATATLGLGVATLLIACIPSFRFIGILAPILLGLCRLFQNLCIAGQTTGGALLLMQSSKEKRNFASGMYESIAEIGALLATGGLALLAYFNLEKELWRLLFIFGSSIGFFAFSSLKKLTPRSNPTKENYSHALIVALKKNPKPFILACLFSGFAYGNYALIQALFTGLLPLASSISYSQAMQLCYMALMLDIALLPLMGMLSDRYGKGHVSRIAASLLVLLSPYLIYQLPYRGLSYAACVYFTLITLGTALVAPFYHWLWSLAPKKSTYSFIALAKAFGLQFIGAPMAPLAIYLYRLHGSFVGPGCLMAFIGLVQLISILIATKHLKENSQVT